MEILSDIIDELCKYLKPVNIYRLSLTSKYYKNHINVKKFIIKEINVRLNEIFDEKIYQFKDSLSDAFISCSFIIQCILGEYCNNSNINIYVPCHPDITIWMYQKSKSVSGELLMLFMNL